MSYINVYTYSICIVIQLEFFIVSQHIQKYVGKVENTQNNNINYLKYNTENFSNFTCVTITLCAIFKKKYYEMFAKPLCYCNG